jgi:hypothetical protein
VERGVESPCCGGSIVKIHFLISESKAPQIERYNLRMDTSVLVAEIDAEIDRLQKVRVLLIDQTASPKRGRQPATKPKTLATSFGFGKSTASRKRTMSAEGRARIAAAQKARWTKAKKKA